MVAPSVAGGHREVDRDGPERGERGRAPGERLPRLVRDDARRGAGRPRRAPAVDGHVDELRELAREVLDVDARAAVDVRRVLAGEEGRANRVRCRHARPCRPRRSRRARRRTASGRARGRRRGGAPGLDDDVLVDDRVADDRALADVGAVQERRSPRRAPASGRGRRARGPSGGRSPPEMIAPAQTIESTAMPGVARVLEHELRRRLPVGRHVDRPVRVVEVEDRVGRDQVHVGVVVGVERPDVAPVAVLALRRRPGRRRWRSRTPAPRRGSTSIGMMSRPMSWVESSFFESSVTASISARAPKT